MRKYKYKCKYCNEKIEPEELEVINIVNTVGNEKEVRLHNKCVNEYLELMEYKKIETNWFNEIYNHIMELLGYTSEQQLPNSLITRLQDLRNGTIVDRVIGRVNKSKEGYPYQVILDTFLDCSDSIRWSFENKVFDTETRKINYMMAIIDANINNNYNSYKNKLDSNIVKQRDNVIEEEKIIENNIKNNLIIKSDDIYKPKKGISSFLEDDEF